MVSLRIRRRNMCRADLITRYRHQMRAVSMSVVGRVWEAGFDLVRRSRHIRNVILGTHRASVSGLCSHGSDCGSRSVICLPPIRLQRGSTHTGRTGRR